jgi:transglutaminase-like putative cysteine protease/predicted glutamine amidotransferase
MPNLLAMSFEGALTPAFDLHCLERGKALPDGWGIACYPGGEPSASVLKEAAPPQESPRSALVETWERLESSIFLVHIRSAKWGAITEANTQPFHRPWGRREWLFGHPGSLTQRITRQGRFEPVGSTDSEEIFCELLARIAERGARSFGEVEPAILHGWLAELNRHGALSLVMTDGQDLVAYSDRRGEGRLHACELLPPYEEIVFGDAELTVDLTRRGSKSRKGIVVSTEPLSGRGAFRPEWRPMQPGSLIVVREGALRAELSPEGAQADGVLRRPTVGRARPLKQLVRAEVQRYRVLHRTSYEYAKEVERSTHLLRLFPIEDRLQSVKSCEVTCSVAGQTRDFEDVFGNRARRLNVESPFSRMVLEAKSVVELSDTDPLDFRPLRVRSTIPLAWMPWQRQVLGPYLLPPELPETELAELNEYAMSFVTRNDYDVLDTLLDINHTIFNEYRYQQGVTTLATTPFQVYVTRRGVCQDFANLFICLARLLGVPARYVCGYLFTGHDAANKAQSDASHAWVQVYLQEVGWKGFDPTNGVLTQTEHVRVAVGRNYIDATPTSGTLFVGGGGERLSVEVHLVKLDERGLPLQQPPSDSDAQLQLQLQLQQQQSQQRW